MPEAIICFGQQPNGFFPKNFFVAKIRTAKKLQQQIGGNIVYFFHDSDADYRETITVFHDRQTGAEVRLNFLQENKIQKKFSPLYAKRIPAGWQQEILKQLPRFVDQPIMDLFASIDQKTVADFCLNMYNRLGLLDDITVIRSGDPDFRQQTSDLPKDYYADIIFQSEIVRAKKEPNGFSLHEGGEKYLHLPDQPVEKRQKNAGRDQRFAWMQSVIHCTHYIYGEGEKAYLKTQDFPEVTFVDREEVEKPGEARMDY